MQKKLENEMDIEVKGPYRDPSIQTVTTFRPKSLYKLPTLGYLDPWRYEKIHVRTCMYGLGV